MLTTALVPIISRQQAIAVAESDAQPVYGDLNNLTLEVALHDDGWHVDYWLRKRHHAGGGPHYIISAETGEILSKTYYQ